MTVEEFKRFIRPGKTSAYMYGRSIKLKTKKDEQKFLKLTNKKLFTEKDEEFINLLELKW